MESYRELSACDGQLVRAGCDGKLLRAGCDEELSVMES